MTWTHSSIIVLVSEANMNVRNGVITWNSKEYSLILISTFTRGLGGYLYDYGHFISRYSWGAFHLTPPSDPKRLGKCLIHLSFLDKYRVMIPLGIHFPHFAHMQSGESELSHQIGLELYSQIGRRARSRAEVVSIPNTPIIPHPIIIQIRHQINDRLPLLTDIPQGGFLYSQN